MSALLDLLKAEPSGMPSTSARRKALAWARVSTDMQEERGLSLPEQLRQIQEYALQLDIEIVEEFSEAASAYKSKAKRPEFDRMLARAREDSDISVILVHDLSRFSRDSINAQTLIRDLRRAGVEVLSVSDPVIDRESVAGVYMEHILLAKNEAYSREVAFHTKKGCRANVQTRDPETGWCYKNGGQPLWGYRSETLQRGEERRGRPIYKSIWVPDDTIVSGRPVFEWTKECLRMAADGASLDKLRDFCNSHEIPAPRSRYWGATTWHSILELNCLLKYAGYEVWNVRGKQQRRNPPEEWVVVPSAHEALISEEEALQIHQTRQAKAGNTFGRAVNRTRRSHYLLSGGIFTCARCGSRMIGYAKSNGKTYYVCGSLPNRRGLGCGPGVYVPREELEREVIRGMDGLISRFAEGRGFVTRVNEKLEQLWREQNGCLPDAAARLAEVDRKIDNLWRAIEDGIIDTSRANDRLKELQRDKDALEKAQTPTSGPPRIDAKTVRSYLADTQKLLASGDNETRKDLLRRTVEHIELAPEQLEVKITYRVPEPILNDLTGRDSTGSGGLLHQYAPIVLAAWVLRRCRLAKSGRHARGR